MDSPRPPVRAPDGERLPGRARPGRPPQRPASRADAARTGLYRANRIPGSAVGQPVRSRRAAFGQSAAAAIVGVAVGISLALVAMMSGLPHSGGALAAPPGRSSSGFVDPEFAPISLTSRDPSASGWFGMAVAVSGSTYVVGAPEEANGDGDAYVVNESTGAAETLVHPTDSDIGFGQSVAVASGRIIVGAPLGGSPETGLVYVYNEATDALEATYSSPEAQTFYDGFLGEFGWAVAASGTWIVVGAPYENTSGVPLAGHAYIINAATGQMRMIESPDPQEFGQFGSSVAVSGNFVLVGAPDETPAGTAFTGAGDAYLFSATTGDLITTYTSPGPFVNEIFGTSVAVDGPGGVAVVGAPCTCEDSGGGAYEYNLDSGSLQALASPNPSLGGAFGSSVAASDGIVVVGAPGEPSDGVTAAGNAYVFSESSGSLIGSDLAPPDPQEYGEFGRAVAENGTAVVVGAPTERASGLAESGQAFLFTQVPLQVSSPNAAYVGDLGSSVAVDNGVVVAGAPYETANDIGEAGHAYLLAARDGPILTLTSPNVQDQGLFGFAVGMAGQFTFVGAPYENVTTSYPEAGRVYEYNTSTGALIRTLTAPGTPSEGRFGYSLAASGNLVVVGADAVSGNGAAYVFYASNGTRAATLLDPTSGDWAFGFSVAVSGGTVAVGAPLQGPDAIGAAFVFNATKGTLIDSFTNPDGLGGAFGLSVALGAGNLVVGAPENTFGSTTDAGNVYLFSVATAALLQNVTSPNAISYGYFGQSVADNGGTIVIGAPGETAFGFVSVGSAYLLHASGGALYDRYNSPVLSQDGSFDFGVAVAIGPGGMVAVGAEAYSDSGPFPGYLYLFFL